MSEEKKLIRIQRTITFDHTARWPEDYSGMSLAEAGKHERELDPDDIIEVLSYSEDAKFESTVEILDHKD